MKRRMSVVALIVAAVAVGGATETLAPRAHAKPAPEVEYMYNVAVRRHYNFPNNDAIGYGTDVAIGVAGGNDHGVCDVGQTSHIQHLDIDGFHIVQRSRDEIL